ncbi:tRNA 2-selenouridine(34) synthase MnmH [Pleionea sediminis]|uniref:tRNA 2-selenouridine(34) synthase MnmH n=1 Tax=Pleionea sediminis TaxID=2569479 RepID=UPI0011853669|nr:tRNA 2-selenouridine(34) synthase MnmH [Pleionea sediminis]
MNWIVADQFESLFKYDTPFIDVRAPIESIKGTFPTSFNLPILNNDERARVGTEYKRNGKSAAIELGYQLIQGETKEERVRSWISFFQKYKESCLYCFRGGLRSKISAEWLLEQGISIPVIEGGYKALRRFLLKVISDLKPEKFRILSGMTGVGKTEVIRLYSNAIDLEKLANHRGSSFGNYVSSQPSQASFENSLAIQLIKLSESTDILLEDESRLIGKCYIPIELQTAMRQAPVIVIEEVFEERIERIYQEYIIRMITDFQTEYPSSWKDHFELYLMNSLLKMKKRLGNESYYDISRLIQYALKGSFFENKHEQHYEWISLLLINYYDPMYRYQIAKKAQRIVHKGNLESVKAYLKVFE